jgi:tRNA A37 methylthiotransferase MiaB
MSNLDVLFIGSVMNYDGTTGSLANYIRHNGKWIAPFQYIYDKRKSLFTSEADACVYDIPNLTICELVDYLKHQDELNYHIIWHFDYHKEKIIEILKNSPPTIIAISSTLAFFPQYLKQCVNWLNAHKPHDSKIVIGGKYIFSNFVQSGATSKLDKILFDVNADYFIINRYGQQTLHQLLLALRDKDQSKAQTLPNIAYRKIDVVDEKLIDSKNCMFKGKYYYINYIIEETNIQKNQTIDFSFINNEFMKDIVHVRTTSSCPFHCRFCTFPALAGQYIMFEIEDVIKQLLQLKKMGVKYLFFIDDTFNVPLKRFEQLLDRMIESNLDIEWVSFFRPQFATPDIVKKMSEAGCRMVFCGIESGNDAILQNMNKRVTVKQFEDGFTYLDRAGITIAASYFIGYPGETYKTAMDTMNLINDPRIAFSRGSIFYYDPSAPVGSLAEEYKLTGNGADWRHATMNSTEAAEIHLEIVDKIKSVNVQISDGAGWSVFHLYSRGISFDDLKELYTEFNRIQKNQIQAAGNRALSQYRVFNRHGKTYQS